jgi:hypothetical protein
MRDVLAESRAVVVTAHALARDLMTAEAVQALRRVGVRSVVLKGPSIARWLYADGHPRPYGDTDLLVSPADLEPAADALRSIGYLLFLDDRIAPGADAHHVVWHRSGDGAVVELHWRLPGVRLSPDAAWRRLSAGTETTFLAGAEVEFLGLQARALHLALHATQHGEDRWKALEDLRRGIRCVDASGWRAAAQLAAALDALDAFAAGLRAIPEGVALATSLELPRARLSTMVEMRAAGASDRSIALQRLLSQRRPLAVARALRHVVFPPVEYMRFRYPEARSGRAALVLAYVRRWRSQGGDVVPVLRRVVRANTEPHR